MSTLIDENSLKLFSAQAEALHCVVVALMATNAINEEALKYLLSARLQGRADDDLTALGVAQLLGMLEPDKKKPPVLRLIQGDGE